MDGRIRIFSNPMTSQIQIQSLPRKYSMAAERNAIAFNQKHKTNSGYKHNDKAHFTFDLTFRMLQHALSELTVEQIQIRYI